MLLQFCLIFTFGTLNIVGQRSNVPSLNYLDVLRRISVPNDAVCTGRRPAYLAAPITSSSEFQSSTQLIGVTSSQCKQICSRNQTPNGRRIACGSFDYHHGDRQCSLHREQVKPDGSGNLKIVAGSKQQYFEKFCLPGKRQLCSAKSLQSVPEAQAFARSVFRLNTDFELCHSTNCCPLLLFAFLSSPSSYSSSCHPNQRYHRQLTIRGYESIPPGSNDLC
ncbi:unnamed protein product [Soboliphyme baturini]|uniref:Apple domain-containing protein n=1 Tax=Soboliphyme baturini TaxID=241478 RepID=A0A183IPU9_9BILA|nr:unnamed protein product [Soboliphyme baturini]